ncbi:hypothetical protein HWV62_1166 [Athelia sp. TMB]|nr:hypothetical protein HWV62_1166 [Athelia sp. TMB]
MALDRQKATQFRNACAAFDITNHDAIISLSNVLDQLTTELAKSEILSRPRQRMGKVEPHIWPELCVLWRTVAETQLSKRHLWDGDDHSLRKFTVNLGKFTRNVVAGIAYNQEQAYPNEPDIRRLLHYHTSWTANEDTGSYKATRALVQTLSNLVTTNEPLLSDLWNTYMNLPEEQVILIRLLASPDPSTVLATLIFVVNCVHKSPERSEVMCTSTIGARVCISLLDRIVTLYDAVEPSDGAKAFDIGADEVLAPHQTTLLKLLDSYLQSSADSTIHSHLCPTLSEIFFRLTAYAQLAIRTTLGPAASDGPPAHTPAVHVAPSSPPAQAPDARLPPVCEALVLVTQCVITVTIDEDDEEPDGGAAEGEPRGLRAFFNDARSERGEGLVEILLELLRLLDLFLPRINFGQPVGDVPAGAATDPTGFSYLKRDLVRLLGILVHRNKEVQDRVRLCGGIPVVMNLCVVDERNPYLREHAILTLHNLLKRNPENQSVVDSIKPTTSWDEGGVLQRARNGTYLLASRVITMDAFEDDNNPFETEDRVTSETSSASKVDISEPNSPPPNLARALSQSPTVADKALPPGPQKPPAPAPRTEFCCSRDRWLHSGQDVEILITDAQKTSVNSTSPYITYIIKAGNAHSHHRYSEFESLRSSLVKLYPTVIIPPIPSKNTIGDYAIKQTKAKEDAALIARRKRMLQTFLNRVARHPLISNEHVFHRFLDGEVSWTEVLHSPPLSQIPKNILKAPARNPADPDASPAYAALPNPSAAQPLRSPDQRFLDSEAFTNKFASHVSGPMEKVTRRTLKRWSDDAQDHSDLGAALNGFSLNESGELSAAIEKTGQAVDGTYISTAKLLQELEQNWAEPLHEYSQFAAIIKKILAYRHQKHVQYEMTVEGLESKREKLEELEKSEREAQRLSAALSRGRIGGVGSPSSPRAAEGEDALTTEGETAPQPSESYLPPHPGPNPARRKTSAPGMGLLNALSYTLHGMMDVDPETARRNGITKTRETIASLDEGLQLSVQDLKYANTTIQGDLDRFQRQKVADLREMAISMARSHRDWCKKNLEAWEEAKKEIDKIPNHPNHIPESQNPEAGPSAVRRDSTATVNGR